MTDFDWSKYEVSEEKKPSFDWNQYEAKTSYPSIKKELLDYVKNTPVSKSESAITGALSGLSFGGLDKARAGIGSVLGQGTYEDLLNLYRERSKQNQEENPVTSTLSEVGGSVVSPTPFGKLKAASTIGKIGKGALSGASTGGLIASNKDQDILSGASLGTLVGGALPAIAAPFKAGMKFLKPENLKERAEILASKAAGWRPGSSKSFESKTAQGFIDKVRETGRELIDRGIIKPGATAQEMLTEVEKYLASSGEKIGNIVKTATGNAPNIRKGQIILDTIKGINKGKTEDIFKLDKDSANQLQGLKNILKGASSLSKKVEVTKSPTEYISPELRSSIVPKKEIIKIASKETPLSGLQDIKGVLQDKIYPGGKFDPTKKVYNKALESVRETLEKEIEKSGEKLKSTNPELFKDYLQSKKTYSALSRIEEPLRKKFSSDLGNKDISLTDTIAGAEALSQAAQGRPVSAGLSLASKILYDKLGAPTRSLVYEALSKKPLLNKLSNIPGSSKLNTQNAILNLLNRINQ